MNSNIYNNMNLVNPTYDQFIIKPPARNITHGNISDIFMIDSRQRDTVVYPKSCDYRLNLDEDYKDVISVELVIAQIPNTGYNIHDGNNQILIEDNSNNSYVIKLENGEYTNQSFIDYLNGSKGNLFWESQKNANQKFNFYVDPDTNKLTIQSNNPFKFNNIRIYKDDLSKTPHTNILNKCNRMNIDDYFRQINFNSVDKTLGFNRKAYQSINLYDDNNGCDLSCNDYDQKNVSNIEIMPPKQLVFDLSYGKITIDVSNNCDLRNIYNEGDYIKVGPLVCQIINIIDNNHMNIKAIDDNISVLTDMSGQILCKSYVIKAQNVFDIEYLDYVILDIPQFDLLESDTNSLRDAFTIIPLSDKSRTVIDKSLSNFERTKYFNPPLAKLSNINIKFKRYDGSSYDFNGKDHVLGFKITCLNQPGKYNDFNN